MRKEFDPFDIAVGSIIKDARKSKNLRAQDMANYLGIYKSTYFYIEAGKVGLSLSRLIKICTYLGIDYVDVMERAREITKNGR
ncbi:MAG: helix-turn-helix transcriptional regulator [Bacteroidales bacterium]|nr:helix-turn-helix transcriptional regulator [Candidatus Scybalousia scybalohippi]